MYHELLSHPQLNLYTFIIFLCNNLGHLLKKKKISYDQLKNISKLKHLIAKFFYIHETKKLKYKLRPYIRGEIFLMYHELLSHFNHNWNFIFLIPLIWYQTNRCHDMIPIYVLFKYLREIFEKKHLY
jgi:hypothetical protein